VTFDPTLCARRLREHRDRLGLTQVQLADGLVRLSRQLYGVQCAANDRLIRAWERGEKRPGPYYQRLLCGFFDVTPDELGFPARSLACPQRRMMRT
jgi:transcriptional regulator with XRE-family HTH domain